jgi:hypothetical protein
VPFRQAWLLLQCRQIRSPAHSLSKVVSHLRHRRRRPILPARTAARPRPQAAGGNPKGWKTRMSDIRPHPGRLRSMTLSRGLPFAGSKQISFDRRTMLQMCQLWAFNTRPYRRSVEPYWGISVRRRHLQRRQEEGPWRKARLLWYRRPIRRRSAPVEPPFNMAASPEPARLSRSSGACPALRTKRLAQYAEKVVLIARLR